MQTFLLACYICLQLSNLSNLNLNIPGNRDASCDLCLNGLNENPALLSGLNAQDSLPRQQTPKGSADSDLQEVLQRQFLADIPHNPFKSRSQQKEATYHKIMLKEQQPKNEMNYDEVLASMESSLKNLNEKTTKAIQKKSEEVASKIQQLNSELDTFIDQQRQALIKEVTTLKNSIKQRQQQQPKSVGSVGKNVLMNGARLLAGESLESQNGNYKAVMQTNGELVIFDKNGNIVRKIGSGGSSAPRANHHLLMQKDGNLVIYNNDDFRPVWQSSTLSSDNGTQPFLKLEDNGQLVIYGKGGRKIWESGVSSFGKRL